MAKSSRGNRLFPQFSHDFSYTSNQLPEGIQVLKQPQCDLIVRVGEDFGEIAFRISSGVKAVQAGTLLWLENREIKPRGKKVLSLLFLKGLSFNKSKCGKVDNIL